MQLSVLWHVSFLHLRGPCNPTFQRFGKVWSLIDSFFCRVSHSHSRVSCLSFFAGLMRSNPFDVDFWDLEDDEANANANAHLVEEEEAEEEFDFVHSVAQQPAVISETATTPHGILGPHCPRNVVDPARASTLPPPRTGWKWRIDVLQADGATAVDAAAEAVFGKRVPAPLLDEDLEEVHHISQEDLGAQVDGSLLIKLDAECTIPYKVMAGAPLTDMCIVSNRTALLLLLSIMCCEHLLAPC